MKKVIFVTVALVLALLGGRGILAQSTPAPAQTATALPTFELDKTWPPKLPNGWVMGRCRRSRSTSAIMSGFYTAHASFPQNRARIARLPCSNSTQRENLSRGGADREQATNGPRTNTASSSTIKTSSGLAARREQVQALSSTRRSPTSACPSMTTCCSSSRRQENFCSRSAGRMPAVETRTRRI